jgi:hypothetical protein
MGNLEQGTVLKSRFHGAGIVLQKMRQRSRMSQNRSASHLPTPAISQPDRDPELCLRRASACLEKGGLKDAAHWMRLAADAIAEKTRGH